VEASINIYQFFIGLNKDALNICFYKSKVNIVLYLLYSQKQICLVNWLVILNGGYIQMQLF